MILSDQKTVVRADGIFGVGDEVIVDGGIVVGLAEKCELTVWLD